MAHGGTLRSALERVSLVRLLVGLGIVLVAINIAAAVWGAYVERERVFRDSQRDVSNVTSLLVGQTEATLKVVDLVLRDVDRIGSAEQIAMQADRLRDEVAYVPQIAAILVFDQQGQIVARTGVAPLQAPMRPYFEGHRQDSGGGIHVSAPYLGGPERRSWRVAVSRRLNRPDGSFGGAVAALVEVESIERLYRMVDLGDGGFISTFTADGTVIARVPDPNQSKGTQLGNGVVLQTAREKGRVDGRIASEVLNEPIFISIAAVRGFPLFVSAGRTERAALNTWRRDARHTVERTVLTSLAMFALVGLAAWGLQRRERALQANEKRFRAMIERSSDAVVLNGMGARGIFYVSPAFERITGHALADVRGGNLFDLVHPDQLVRTLQAREAVLRTPGRPWFNEWLLRHRDGSYRWVEGTATNLLDDPAVGAIVINLRDIHERKLAEAERERLEGRLRQSAKMEAVGRLAGGIAHDFNNILGGILGYAELLVDSAPEGSAERRYARNVLTGAERASALVEQILTYSRSHRGKRAAVDLGAIVAETLELVRGSLANSIRLEAALPAAPLHVMADPTQLHQVVMNLCTNALQAIGEHGTIRLSIEAAEVAEERLFAHTTLAAGRYALLKVDDSGRGMDTVTLARLFEPFFTTKEVGQGTGLGLALVYGIVTDSGGAIDVASTPGRGSSFAVYLPLVDAPSQADGARAAPPLRGNGERILVVDDEDALLAAMCETLKHLGYEPTGFAGADAALADFERDPRRYDAVLTDEVMPNFTGTQLATVLRGRRADLPVVLVSGLIGPATTELAISAGIRETLKKPVHADELAAVLARVLGRC
jgi:PAS domain S-box-containing protein